MTRHLSISELENFPSLDWSDIAPTLTTTVRNSLERILETQNGNTIPLEDAYALANADGDDLLGPARRGQRAARRTFRQHRHLRRQSQHQLHQHLFCGMQILRLQPRTRASPILTFWSRAQVAQKAVEAWQLGATEVCIQGGLPHGLPPVLLSRHSARGKECYAAHAHPCILANGNRLRR